MGRGGSLCSPVGRNYAVRTARKEENAQLDSADLDSPALCLRLLVHVKRKKITEMLATLRLAHQPRPVDVPLRSIVEIVNMSGHLAGFLEKCGHPNLQTLSLADCTLDGTARDNLAKLLSLPSLTSVTLAYIKGV